MNRIQSAIAYLSASRAGQLGVALSTAAGITIASFFTADFFGVKLSPYAGIVGFIGLPALLLIGLALIATGLRRRSVSVPSSEIIRRTGAFIGVMTVVNLLILLSTSYRAVHDMDSEQFCGQTCHVMRPQFLAHAGGPHSKVLCTECHIAAGVGGFINAKLAGSRQLVLFMTGGYSRPIHGDAKANCTNCHTTPRPGAEKLVTRTHYADDEKNTRSSTSLSVRTGLIHRAHGKDDCGVCHNRAGHDFGDAEEVVEAALEQGRLDPSVPFIKKQALASLTSGAPLPPAGESKVIEAIRAEHLFPAMNVGWETYPTNLGHKDSGGCFRCHDGGKAKNDCDTCHSFLEIKKL
jgi:hypothetical protein